MVLKTKLGLIKMKKKKKKKREPGDQIGFTENRPGSKFSKPQKIEKSKFTHWVVQTSKQKACTGLNNSDDTS
jgi:hypothetical protein